MGPENVFLTGHWFAGHTLNGKAIVSPILDKVLAANTYGTGLSKYCRYI